MSEHSPSNCNLRWRELLSSEEIRAWVGQKVMPSRLPADSGVYRFVFPKARDGDSAHTPCYIGEAGNIGKRLRAHFRLGNGNVEELSLPKSLRPGWQVRGAIQNSGGEFRLEILAIVGPVNFGGLTFDQDTIPNPLENPFLRRMLENWAILTSEWGDNLRPINQPGTPHILKDLLAYANKKTRRKNNATQK